MGFILTWDSGSFLESREDLVRTLNSKPQIQYVRRNLRGLDSLGLDRDQSTLKDAQEYQLGNPKLKILLGGPRDLVATHNWAYNLTYNPPTFYNPSYK